MSRQRIPFPPDYIFSVVQVPKDWKPAAVYDVPPVGKIISQMPVASFDEAHDDLVRCNRLAMKHGLHRWAVVQTAEARI
jgi:hypothetical protein